RSLAQQDGVVVRSAGDQRAAESLRDRHRHHEHGDHHGDAHRRHRRRALAHDHRAQVVVGDQSHAAIARRGRYATRRSASTIFSLDAAVAGITAASRPMTRLSARPTATLPLLTPKAGMNPPARPSASAFTVTRASIAPRIPPITATSTPSPTTSRKIVDDGNPSVRITAISVVRSRTDIAIVLPATNSVVSTTASATLPSR